MKNGVLKINLSTAVAGYALRRWNVDCSPKHSLKGGEYHLALKNLEALDGDVDTRVWHQGFQNEAKYVDII